MLSVSFFLDRPALQEMGCAILVLLLTLASHWAAGQNFYVTSAGPTVGFRVGQLGSVNPINPTLNVTLGQNVTFLVDTIAAHRFSIHTAPNSLGAGLRYNSSFVSGTNPAFVNATLSLFLVRLPFVVSCRPDLTGGQGPGTPAVLYYQCEQHIAMGGAINVLGGTVTDPVSSSSSGYVIAHAVLMTVAFALLIPLGVMTSSFLPHQLVVSWLPIHVGLQVVAACCMFAGFGVILYVLSDTGIGHFNNAATTATNHCHSIFGVIIISLIVVQISLGIFSDAWWRIQFWRKGSIPLPGPFPEKTHWWLGRALVIMSVVQIYLGLVEGQDILGYGNWVYGLYAAWYGLMLIVAVVAIVKLRRVLRAKKRDANPRDRVKDSSKTPVADSEHNSGAGAADHGDPRDTGIIEL